MKIATGWAGLLSFCSIASGGAKTFLTWLKSQ